MPNSTDLYRNRHKTGNVRPERPKPVERRPMVKQESAREMLHNPAMRGLKSAMKR